jgi:hypothetical protein
MIYDWQNTYKDKKYARLEWLGGPGDKGRDVKCTWLNGNISIYQCKNYEGKLGPSQIFPEIAKCCYYSFNKDYPTPIEYLFVAPHGVSPYVSDLLLDSIRLKKELKDVWSTSCQPKVHVPLGGALEAFIDNMDFSIIGHVTPKEFLEDFEKTCYYSEYFGDIKKPRPLGPYKAPDDINEKELIYIAKILAAYGEFLDKNICDEKQLKIIDQKLYEDFKRNRLYFYSADCLAQYSREVYPPDMPCFNDCKEQFYHGIIDDIVEDANHGYERLRKVIRRAAELDIALGEKPSVKLRIQDKKGICHHLANEREDIKWANK